MEEAGPSVIARHEIFSGRLGVPGVRVRTYSARRSSLSMARAAKKHTKKEVAPLQKEELESENVVDENYDEEADDDYDPLKKNEDADDEDNIGDEEAEKVPDYLDIQATVSSVRTRSQRDAGSSLDKYQESSLKRHKEGVSLDVDSIFADLRLGKAKAEVSLEWRSTVEDPANLLEEEPIQPADNEEDGTDKIKIQTSYTFAGKVVTETKLVDANSAEAKAYMNSTSFLSQIDPSRDKVVRAFVPILRLIPGSTEPIELRIKLKRPSLIDKFLASQGKKLKLSTLEKSRLDWASFVDKRKLNDDLKLHNKAGYLDKQDFLGRVQSKRDDQYVEAREAERQRQWKLNKT